MSTQKCPYSGSILRHSHKPACWKLGPWLQTKPVKRKRQATECQPKNKSGTFPFWSRGPSSSITWLSNSCWHSENLSAFRRVRIKIDARIAEDQGIVSRHFSEPSFSNLWNGDKIPAFISIQSCHGEQRYNNDDSGLVLTLGVLSTLIIVKDENQNLGKTGPSWPSQLKQGNPSLLRETLSSPERGVALSMTLAPFLHLIRGNQLC